MMRFVFAAVFVGLVSPAAAQDRMTETGCQGGWVALHGLLGEGDSVTAPITVAEDGWCLVKGLELPTSAYQRVVVETLRWRATDIARFAENGLPPRAFEATVTGLRVIPQPGDPVLDYLYEVQSRRNTISAEIGIRWDQVQKAVILDRLAVNFQGANSLRLTGRVAGVDLTDMASLQTSAGTAGLTALDLTTESNGLFESLLLLPFGVLVLEEDTEQSPEDQVAALVQSTRDMVAALPDALLPPRSKQALNALLDQMPTPSGSLRLQVQTTEPIGMARLMPLAGLGAENDLMTALQTALEGVTLNVNWTPTQGAN